MNKAKHTPGPWIRSGVRHKLGGEDCLVVGPDGFGIAYIPIGKTAKEHAGAMADARLIAAAPTLLAALQLLYSEVLEYQQINKLGGYDNQAMQVAREAFYSADPDFLAVMENDNEKGLCSNATRILLHSAGRVGRRKGFPA